MDGLVRSLGAFWSEDAGQGLVEYALIIALVAVGLVAILLVEQYFEFARDLADRYAVMDRGQVVLSGTRAEMVESDVRRRLSV